MATPVFGTNSRLAVAATRAALMCLSLSAVLIAADDSTEISITKDTATTFYRNFKRLTQQPHHVAPLIAVSCISPSPDPIELERRATGPHFSARVHIYANALASTVSPRSDMVIPTTKIPKLRFAKILARYSIVTSLGKLANTQCDPRSAGAASFAFVVL